jgi:hypothetical protein
MNEVPIRTKTARCQQRHENVGRRFSIYIGADMATSEV